MAYVCTALRLFPCLAAEGFYLKRAETKFALSLPNTQPFSHEV
jgi:hypothetical protein